MCLRQTRAPRATGFTLIELLVVVSIIALLISILLPSLKNARKQAQAVACAANSKNVATALATYQIEFNGYVPHNVWSERDWPIWYDPNIKVLKQHLWFYKLFPRFLQDPDILICQGDPFRGKFVFRPEHPSPSTNELLATAPSCGYGLNYGIREIGFDNPRSFNIETYGPTRPAETILFAEVGPDDELETYPLYEVILSTGQPWRDGGRIVYDHGERGWFSGPTWLTTRHLGAINMTSMDGAVHRVRTRLPYLLEPDLVRQRYDDCALGDCLYCSKRIGHYNFSHARLWWWTGPEPGYPQARYQGPDSQE